MSTESFRNEGAAIRAFSGKFTNKTHNRWENRHNFVKVSGKYQLMDIDYAGQVEEQQEVAEAEKKSGGRKRAGDDANEAAAKRTKEEAPAAAPVSQLPPPVQELLKLIGSKSAMEMTMKELNIDTKRMPLGKISKEQIKKGYEILQKVEALLSGNKKAAAGGSLEELSSAFYTLIPHDFGFQRPPLINTKDMVKVKGELLDTLGQLEIATKLLETEADKAKAQKEAPRHYLDVTYDSLHCSITPLDPTSEAYRHIIDSVENTHGETHTTYKLRVKSIFVIAREGERARYVEGPHAATPGKYMLWHGSRSTNYMGILSQGLRIAPKEAPCTGYMFGKGIYFADIVSKSANYCFTNRQQNMGLMLLNEVAVGRPLELTQAKYMEAAQKGSDSTKGIGRMRPGFETVVNGPQLDLPASEAKKMKQPPTDRTIQWPTKKIEHDTTVQTSLYYSEYIVYDVAQCYMRYLVMTEFVYK
ncbi:poly [ADP-ribose] polymerase [Strigomonas culicis]|nr:poly [ADP-ribose] polymerase [Strigomonas culicis]|eukprot:EPY23145.1 poly [ADP-ribose] polymerase [Strigomonas culicis]